MTRVGIAGAAGRMGRTLVQAVHAADDLTLGAALEHPDSEFVGTDAGELAGVGNVGLAIAPDLTKATGAFDVLIDFTVPQATLSALAVCRAAGRGMAIGTTGFDAAGLEAIREASSEIPILMAPNMSIGVNVAFKLLEVAAKALGESVDVEIAETHHRHKIDAPSGTAVRMGEIVANALGRDLDQVAEYGRSGIGEARARETIGFHSIRAGDVVGDHTVTFASEGERIEITHKAQSRKNFAAGALRAVRFLADKPNGLFDMQTLLGLS